MLLIYLLNYSQQQCLLTEMVRLLEKHPYAIDAFIGDFSTIMFSKPNGSSVLLITCCFRYIYCRFSRLCLLRQMDQRLEKHPFANNAFIVYFSTIMFAKTNGSTVGLIPCCFRYIYCRFSRLLTMKNGSTVCKTPLCY